MDYEIKQSIIKKSKERESGLSLSMSSSTFKITEASQNFIFKWLILMSHSRNSNSGDNFLAGKQAY